MPSILGCVAGDDTVIIVTATESASAELSEKITELMKTF
jgi:arginine repressor